MSECGWSEIFSDGSSTIDIGCEQVRGHYFQQLVNLTMSPQEHSALHSDSVARHSGLKTRIPLKPLTVKSEVLELHNTSTTVQNADHRNVALDVHHTGCGGQEDLHQF